MKAPKIIYIPGWASSPRIEPQLITLLKEKFAVETLWLPDYGNPDWMPDMTVSALYLDRLARRIEQEPEPVSLIGWSTGGLGCLELALAHPAKVRSLTLISSTARFCAGNGWDHGKPVEEVESLRLRLQTDPTAALRGFFLGCYHPSRPDKGDLAERVRDALSTPGNQLDLGLRYLISADFTTKLSSIQAPTLVLHGVLDAIIPVHAARSLAQAIPNAEIRLLDNSGHMLPDTNADELFESIASQLGLGESSS